MQSISEVFDPETALSITVRPRLS